MRGQLFLDDLASTPDAKVVLVHDLSAVRDNDGTKLRDDNRLKTYTSYVVDDLVLSASADYSAPFADIAAQAQEFLNKAQVTAATGASTVSGTLSNAAQEILGKALGTSVRSYAQSVLSWTNSERPTFSIPMHFVTWRSSQVGGKGV